MMYSAAGTLLGSAGQANYTGANSFLDALAQEMRRTGRPGFALNLGPVKEVGFGATPEGQKIHALWERRGIIRVTVEELAQALELLLPQPRAQIGLMRTDPERLARSYAGSVSQAALSRIIDLEAPGAGADLIPRLEAAAPEARHELLALELQRTVVQVMALDEAEAPELDQGLFELGLDSLLAMDLKNRIEAGLRTDFPATAIFDHPTLEALARYLLVEVLRMDVDEAAAPAAPAAVDLLEEIGSLSADEAEALLAQELAGAGEAAPSRPDAKG
jgi:acyl carrier protein